MARRRPFDSLSDDEVVANCHRHAAVTSSGAPSTGAVSSAMLDQPGTCPREIYDLMLECWRVEAPQRPAFREIHMFLQRKNSGYSPDDEPLHCQQTVSDV